MNNYRVRITRRNGGPIDGQARQLFRDMVEYEFVGERFGKFESSGVGVVDYTVPVEKEAVYVYGMFKRFLDMRRYSVTLELPGKGESC